MNSIRFFLVILIFFIASAAFPAVTELKNVLSLEGLQENPLLGYGIVVGLRGTGDSENGSQTKEILSRIANNFGFSISPDKLKPKNSAVVLVSAVILPFSQPGSKIDVKVSSIYDAKSLDGGELVITPLMAGDNEIYAVAQGTLFTERNSKGVFGTVPQGAIIQKQVDHSVLSAENEIALTVQETLGFGAVSKIIEAIQKKFPDALKESKNNRIVLKLPDGKDLNSFISDIFKLKADIEEEPRVLIDSKSGILISGGNVVISEAAISFNGTKLNIGSSDKTSGWGASGTAKSGSDGAMKILKTTTTVQELVDALNQTGASGSDISKILQLLYKNGNLKARLIVQ